MIFNLTSGGILNFIFGILTIYALYIWLIVEYEEKKDESRRFIDYQKRIERHEKVYEKKLGRLYKICSLLYSLKRIEIPINSGDRELWFWSIKDEDYIPAMQDDYECKKKNISRLFWYLIFNWGRINFYDLEIKIKKENINDENYPKIKINFTILIDSKDFEEKIKCQVRKLEEMGKEQIFFEITNDFDCKIRGFNGSYLIDKQYRSYRCVESTNLDFNEGDIEIVTIKNGKIERESIRNFQFAEKNFQNYDKILIEYSIRELPKGKNRININFDT